MQGLKPGSYLGHGNYRIEKVLGQGGFGITYLAYDISLDRPVAIKEFFPKDFCGRDSSTSHVTVGTQNTAQLVERLKAKFLKEARHIAKLDHPGIIKIYASFEDNNTAYYVMEYIKGRNLSELVKDRMKENKGPISEDNAIRYIKTVGESLEFVHGMKMNHLDVKPANILIRDRDDSPVLIDFGLAKQYDSIGNQTSTTPTGISHGYAPAEQYNDGGVKEFSPRTDLYSLAATLYYALSGVVPKQATRLLEEELCFPTSIPERLIPPISKAMSPLRRDRQASIDEFLKEIEPVNVIPNAIDDATEIMVPIERLETKGTQEIDVDNSHEGNEEKVLKGNIPTWIWIVAAGIIAVVISVILYSSGSRREKTESEAITSHVDKAFSSASNTGNTYLSEEVIPDNLNNMDDNGVEKKDENFNDGETEKMAQLEIEKTGPSERTSANKEGVTASLENLNQPEKIKDVLQLGYGTWEGSVKSGKPHGKGKVVFTSAHAVDRNSSIVANPGDYFIATYDNGSLISGKLYDKEDNILKTIIP